MDQVLDIFSGAGFGSQGFKNHFEVVEAIDISKDACLSFKMNHRETKVTNQDIRNISFCHGDYNGIVGLLGTPPCQDYSELNQKRDNNSERANLVFEYIRVLTEVKPQFALFENVYSIPKSVKIRLVTEIENLGYNVVSKVCNAYDYGSVQIRKRWIITAHKNKHVFPKKTIFRRKSKEILTNEVSEIKPRKSTLEKIQNLVPGKWVALENQSYKVYFVVDPEKPLPAVVNPTKLRYIKPDKSGYLSLNELIKAFGVNDFKLIGNVTSKGQQIANGFPADFAEKFALEFIKH